MASKRSKREINSLIDEFDEYNKHVVDLDNERKQLITDVFNVYLEDSKQESLIEDLEKTCFSKVKTEKIKTAFSKYDTDAIDFNVVQTIVEAEKHIRQHSKEEGFFSAIANILISED